MSLLAVISLLPQLHSHLFLNCCILDGVQRKISVKDIGQKWKKKKSALYLSIKLNSKGAFTPTGFSSLFCFFLFPSGVKIVMPLGCGPKKWTEPPKSQVALQIHTQCLCGRITHFLFLTTNKMSIQKALMWCIPTNPISGSQNVMWTLLVSCRIRFPGMTGNLSIH